MKRLAEYGWRYHAPTGFWWRVVFGRKWREHETVLALLADDDYRYVVAFPHLAQGASVPVAR